LAFADLLADLLVAVIDRDAQSGLAQLVGQLAGFLQVTFRDRQDAGLFRGHPERQGAGVFLDQERQRPLVAADRGPVDDDRVTAAAVPVGVEHLEPLSQLEVDLDRDQGVFLAEYIADLDIQFRTVERRFAESVRVVQPHVVEDVFHGLLDRIPLLLGTDIFFAVLGIPGGEAIADILIQPDRPEHERRQVQAAPELALQLVRRADDMPFGNRELAQPDQAVHLTGGLVAEKRRGLGIADRQIPVAAGPGQVSLELEGAGHRAQSQHLFGIGLFRVSHDEHAVPVVVPMAGDLVKV